MQVGTEHHKSTHVYGHANTCTHKKMCTTIHLPYEHILAYVCADVCSQVIIPIYRSIHMSAQIDVNKWRLTPSAALEVAAKNS